MAGQGRWSLQAKYKRCGGQRKCAACSVNPEIPPHGPYHELRRRHPETGDQQFVYLGTKGLSDTDMMIVNEIFRGQDLPTRSEVFLALEHTPVK